MPLASIVAALLLILSTAATAAADVFTLKNGDQLSGTFENVHGTTLTLRDASLGPLDIQFDQLVALDLDAPVVVLVTAHAPQHGWLGLSPARAWVLVRDDGETETIAPKDVDVIVTESSYQAMAHHTATLWQDWTGSMNVGYSVQRGTQTSDTFSTSLATRRERPQSLIFVPHARTNVSMMMLRTNVAEAGASIGTNTVSSSVREDFLFSRGSFVFGLAQLDHVQDAGLALRQTYGGGVGYDVSKTKLRTFSLIGGLTFVREKFSVDVVDQPNDAQSSVQLLFGEKFNAALAPRVALDHVATVYPNLSFPGQFHVDSTTSLTLKLRTHFALTAELIDLYLNNPAVSGQRNNLALTTGLAVTF
ncbi:MAG: DUF481 domain-containing protein [Acidobacteriaceae bacterium]|jgi:putative salt-induced outer membrane protein YdiY|nr:DUF481 domain-containing protein [Acidobacteriaceae bacterium]